MCEYGKGEHTWYIGTLLALYWSLLSVYTNSVANAYLLPLCGLDGAGEGGKSWPSRSTFCNTFAKPLSLPFELPAAEDIVVDWKRSRPQDLDGDCGVEVGVVDGGVIRKGLGRWILSKNWSPSLTLVLWCENLGYEMYEVEYVGAVCVAGRSRSLPGTHYRDGSHRVNGVIFAKLRPRPVSNETKENLDVIFQTSAGKGLKVIIWYSFS